MNWIKISERLPSEEDKRSLIVWWDPQRREADVGTLYYNELVSIGDGWGVNTPVSDYTHWAIIEPPKDEGES